MIATPKLLPRTGHALSWLGHEMRGNSLLYLYEGMHSCPGHAARLAAFLPSCQNCTNEQLGQKQADEHSFVRYLYNHRLNLQQALKTSQTACGVRWQLTILAWKSSCLTSSFRMGTAILRTSQINPFLVPSAACQADNPTLEHLDVDRP